MYFKHINELAKEIKKTKDISPNASRFTHYNRYNNVGIEITMIKWR